MKRVLSLVMAFAVILSLSACGDTAISETTAPLEHVSVEVLFESLENGAKAKSHEGKETTVCGRVKHIGETSCSVELFIKGKSLEVQLPTDVLINMNTGDFVAIDAVVKEYCDAPGNTPYLLEADNLSDNKEVADTLRSLITYYMTTYIEPSTVYYALCEKLNADVFLSYIKNSDEFVITDNEKLHDALIGKWVRSLGYVPGPAEETCEFKADNTYIWNYSTQSYGTKKWFSKKQDGDWTVSNGKISCFMGYDNPETIYFLTDDVFVCMDTLHIRTK